MLGKNADSAPITGLYDCAPVSDGTLDQNGTIRQVNLTGITLPGKDRSLLVGLRFHDFIAAVSLPVFIEFLCTVPGQPGKKTGSVELTLTCDPPVIVQMEARVTGPGGSECLMAVSDITERKREEDALRTGKERFRNVFDWANACNLSRVRVDINLLVLIDHEGKIPDVTAAWELVTWHSRKELIDNDFSDYFTKPEKVKEGYLRVLKEGMTRDLPLENLYLRPTGGMNT